MFYEQEKYLPFSSTQKENTGFPVAKKAKIGYNIYNFL